MKPDADNFSIRELCMLTPSSLGIYSCVSKQATQLTRM